MSGNVVILAGGLATRLRPLTEKFPKAMLEFCGEPFLAYQLGLLKRHGFTKIILCVGYEGKQIEDYFGDGERFGLSLTYSYDGKTLLGTGGAIQKALDYLDDVFLVLYGDSYLILDYNLVLQTFLERYQSKTVGAPLGLMTVYKNDNQLDRSNVIYENNRIVKYDKQDRSSDMKYIDWGLGILSQEAFQWFAKQGAFDLESLYKELVATNKLMGYKVAQRFYEIGSHSGIEEFTQFASTSQPTLL